MAQGGTFLSINKLQTARVIMYQSAIKIQKLDKMPQDMSNASFGIKMHFNVKLLGLYRTDTSSPSYRTCHSTSDWSAQGLTSEISLLL